MTAIPEGYATITPSLVLQDAAKAISLYEKAFGAKELSRLQSPDGKIMHACIQIGSSRLFLCDHSPKICAMPTSSSFYLYFDNVDKAFGQAKQAGLSEIMPVNDMFWGDRVGALADSFGVRWTLASHVRDVSPEDMQQGAKQMYNQAA